MLGHTGQRPSILHVFVDAGTGAVLHSYDDVADGTGNGWIYGSCRSRPAAPARRSR